MITAVKGGSDLPNSKPDAVLLCFVLSRHPFAMAQAHEESGTSCGFSKKCICIYSVFGVLKNPH